MSDSIAHMCVDAMCGKGNWCVRCLRYWTCGSHRQPCSLKLQLKSDVWLCTGICCTSSSGHQQYAVGCEVLLPPTCSGVSTADAWSSPHSVGSSLVGADLVAVRLCGLACALQLESSHA